MNDDLRSYFDEQFAALVSKEDLESLSKDLESLAATTKRRFDDVDERFDFGSPK